jgi:hypothetical protein
MSKQTLIDKASDVKKTLVDYMHDKQNFDKFAASKNYGTPNTDIYYHTAAMYDAAQGDRQRALMAFAAGLYKEIDDWLKYSKSKGFGYATREGAKDMINNIYGINESFRTPGIKAKDNENIKNLQTPTMRDIMPIYEALKHE